MQTIKLLLRGTKIVMLIALVSTVALLVRAQERPDGPRDQSIQDSIRKALEGQMPEGLPDEPLLEDVLDLIQGQGSVLKGSLLDPLVEPLNEESDASGDQASARVAESLLKAARLLENLSEDPSRERTELVRRMRSEARVCLSDFGTEDAKLP